MVDLFPAPGPAPAPLHVFVHGGYWQELGRRESAFAAPGVSGPGRRLRGVQ